MDSPRPSPNSSGQVRLQKYLAQCGVASRRACERLMADGVVSVNGTAATQAGTSVDPDADVVCVRGKRVRPESHSYLLLNKPRDVLCTAHDPSGRRTVFDLLPDLGVRLYTVGRLDRDSEGLVLLTNDGAFANLLTHPRHHVVKIYNVTVSRPLREREQAAFLEGVRDDGDRLRAGKVVEHGRTPARYEIHLHEGRNRQIRRMFEAFDIRVRTLRRVAVGTVRLQGVPSGRWRRLDADEVASLRAEAESDG